MVRCALVALALAGCTGSMEAYFAQDVVDIHRDIPYVDGANIRQKLDLFMPRGLDDVPMVVFIHGGFWLHQDRNFFQPFVGLYGNVGIALAREGIGTAVISYRLAGDVSSFDEEFGDVARAIGWVRDHAGDYGGDGDNLVVAGHSAGGHMTALAGLDEARLAAAGVDVAAIKGYAPLSPILDLQALADFAPDESKIVADVFHGEVARNSPRTYFRAGIKPFLVVLGTKDLDSLKAQVPPAVDELVQLGAPVEYALLPGKNHEDIVLDFDTDADAVTPVLVPFVRAHVP